MMSNPGMVKGFVTRKSQTMIMSMRGQKIKIMSMNGQKI